MPLVKHVKFMAIIITLWNGQVMSINACDYTLSIVIWDCQTLRKHGFNEVLHLLGRAWSRLEYCYTYVYMYTRAARTYNYTHGRTLCDTCTHEHAQSSLLK